MTFVHTNLYIYKFVTQFINWITQYLW